MSDRVLVVVGLVSVAKPYFHMSMSERIIDS